MPAPDHSGFAEALRYDWRAVARPEQLAPPGTWTVWVFNAGRGAGKTRSGAEWIRSRVESGVARYIHLIAPTAADARDVMVCGPSGLLSVFPKGSRPTYSPSNRRIDFANGSQALLFSGEEADRLRGPQADTLWIDELAAMPGAQNVLDMSLLGLRLGADPRCMVTTTPRPTKVYKALLEREGRDVVVTRCATMANSANLARPFLSQILQQYQGTRLGRQELEAELLLDVPGALFPLATLDETRVPAPPVLFQRIVIGVDPAGSTATWADSTGIVVCGLGHDGHGYVLRDASGKYTPAEWARVAVDLFHELRADRVVVERNFGGDMVEATLRSLDPSLPVKAVTSSRGKVLRAEPIAALFEQRRAHLVGSLPALEEQLSNFSASYDRSRDGSPDRLDAMVFALSDLMLGLPAGGLFKEASLLVADAPVPRPTAVNNVYGILAADPATDSVGVVYFAAEPNDPVTAPLVILDWELVEADEVLGPDQLPEILERLWKLASECARAGRDRAPLFVEPNDFGQAVHALGEALREDVLLLPADEFPPDPLARANAARTFVLAGQVKISRDAYEKATEFRGVTRNHLLAQLTSFGTADTKQPTELVSAFVLGILAGLQGAQLVAKVVEAPAPSAEPTEWEQRMARFAAEHAAWRAKRDEALARLRAKHGPGWSPASARALGIEPEPQSPGLRLL